MLYLTSNTEKFHIAELALADAGVQLVQQAMLIPEVQSTIVQEIALCSANWAASQIDQPFFLTVAAFHIQALNGFPGPFVKYVNHWFSVDDYLQLMANQADRSIFIEDCLAYCFPGEPPMLFTAEYPGQLAQYPGQEGGTPIDRLFVPLGFDRPLSEIPVAERRDYWAEVGVWNQLKDYLRRH